MGNIRVIGPRNSGKTTFLAGLAYWPDKQKRESRKKYFNIHSLNDETEGLATRAENIIMEGADLEPTSVHVRSTDELPSYLFRIEIQQPWKKPEEINLAVTDYPGEIFEQLEMGIQDELHQEFIEECLLHDVEGCLILLSDWGGQADRFYKRVFKQFTSLMDKYDRASNLRLAVVISKCERGEIWPGRIEPEIDLFNSHLPETSSLLRSCVPSKNLEFFALSTFGVLHRNDPRPNRIEQWGTDGSRAVLRESRKWKPYGMLAPLYWLSTGKRKDSIV